MTDQQPPHQWAPARPTRISTGQDRIRTLLPAIIGLAVWLPACWLLTGLVAAAWEACDDLDGAQRFGLVFFTFPLMLVATGVAFGSAWFVLKRTALRATLPFLAAIAAVVIVFAYSVPAHGEAAWVDWAGDTICGPGGIPAWWPGWLPS